MKQIEIRLEPSMVESLLETIEPVFAQLENELASPAEFPDEDELLEDFWKNDLLNSQRAELEVMAALFDDEFKLSGRAVVREDEMDKVIRACSAIRLKLRETLLQPLSDAQLEAGDFEELEWTEELQIGYAAYALFAGLQELIISQVFDGGSVDEGAPGELDWGDGEEGSEEKR